jgi:glucokinase
LSAAGVIDPATAQVRDATDAMPGWKGTNLRAALAPEWGVPVQALNDVHAALVGEAWLGALKDQERGAMLTLGTGLGGAWMVQGQLQTGASGVAGHFGRTRVQHQDRWVPVEILVSGQGLAYWHRVHGGTARNGREVLAADPSQPAVVAALRDWTQHLAAVLHNMHWTMDPGLVVLGGGVIESRQRWWPLLADALGELPLSVQPAQLGARAGLMGAAHWAWRSRERA